MSKPSEIYSGADVLPILAKSLTPVVKAIGVAFGPNGRHVLVDREDGSPVALLKGSEISRSMITDGSIVGIAPRLFSEMLYSFERDYQDGTARLAITANAFLSSLVRHELHNANMPYLAEHLTKLLNKAQDKIGRAHV